MTNSLQQLDEFIRNNGLLTHYFYEQKWNNGELTKDQLALYAKEYFHLAKRVPVIVSNVRDRAIARGDTALVAEIEKNIEEETEHIELWKRFSRSLGLSEQDLESYEPHRLTKEAVNELEELSKGSFEDGVTAMYAMELTLPEISQTKKEGLSKHYNLTSEDAHVYFDEHLNEEEHFSVWRKVEVDPVRAKTIIQASLKAQHKVLDGVCEMCGFCVTCH
ncbi:pyrroloquinoline quinone biosynthesis protein PqqC [Candidatus Peregrinibacteria bacterium CG10_big_fil_rev_8_21_14_0_10_42_8]|nr:MAG: pyrroloquinoline quinone biosynthesis protein PqqC [Candidatus Peregrinibacteria bacterium CG10_big_fil_rev_8_21_14_0_10_42_8]